MYNKELVLEVLSQILKSLQIIEKRIKPISCADDFLKNDSRLQRLDAICMQLIALGESIKNLDKITNKSLLKRYPEFEWKKAMAMRDILSHHYFDLNSEIVFEVCISQIPNLKALMKQILKNEGMGNTKTR